ncbi:MAG: hypothetical protein RBT78_03595 [Kiritimatiellia bacterium]|jgi:hypothetical protein|nr:hypothetical protein [Kiritimatiellia bacterium]
MPECVQSVPRFRARIAHRPVLFWWQACLVLGVFSLLWFQLPPEAVFYAPRSFAPLPDAHAAYAVMDPAYAAEAFRKTVMGWTLGGVIGKDDAGVEFGLSALTDALPPPVLLEQGARYPGEWQPLEVDPPAVLPPALLAPGAAATYAPRAPAPLPEGMRVMPDAALRAAGWEVDVPDGILTVNEGQGRFYVETDTDGRVAHVLVFPPHTPSTAALERALARGRARGAARGVVEIFWRRTP